MTRRLEDSGAAIILEATNSPVETPSPEAGSAVERATLGLVHAVDDLDSVAAIGGGHGDGQGLVAGSGADLVAVPAGAEVEAMPAILLGRDLVDGLRLGPRHLLVALGVVGPLREGEDLVTDGGVVGGEGHDEDLVDRLAPPVELTGVDEHGDEGVGVEACCLVFGECQRKVVKMRR